MKSNNSRNMDISRKNTNESAHKNEQAFKAIDSQLVVLPSAVSVEEL